MMFKLTTTVALPGGGVEKSEALLSGHLRREGENYLLQFTRTEEDSKTTTRLSFKESERQLVLMEEWGACQVKMLFCLTESCSGHYAVPGVGSLPFTLHTGRLENTLGESGGRLQLGYRLTLGGEEQHLTLTLLAKEAL